MDGTTHGAEFVADWKAASWLSLIFTYAYLEMDLTLDDPAGITAMKEYLAKSSPRNQASLRSSFKLSSEWQLNFWLRYVDEIVCMDSTNPLGSSIAIEQYYFFDTNLIWTPTKNVEVMLAGQNLLDGEKLQYATEAIIPPTEIERSIYLKTTWRF